MKKKIESGIRTLLGGKYGKVVTIGIGGIAVVLLIVLIANLTVQRTYSSYSVVKTKARSDSSTKGYMSYNEDIIKK